MQQRVQWRCALEGGMVQCVMTTGMSWMPKWSADNWDTVERLYLWSEHSLGVVPLDPSTWTMLDATDLNPHSSTVHQMKWGSTTVIILKMLEWDVMVCCMGNLCSFWSIAPLHAVFLHSCSVLYWGQCTSIGWGELWLLLWRNKLWRCILHQRPTSQRQGGSVCWGKVRHSMWRLLGPSGCLCGLQTIGILPIWCVMYMFFWNGEYNLSLSIHIYIYRFYQVPCRHYIGLPSAYCGKPHIKL